MNEAIEMRLSAARDTCLMYMAQAGYSLKEDVSIQLDPTLPFMGYTTRSNGQPLIVVSQMALDPGPLEGLIIHEMGHIYRTETKHPSHNHEHLGEMIQDFLKKHHLKEEYQLEAFRSISNTIQDLYADDISFMVYEKYPLKTFPKDVFPEFFATWIRQPISPTASEKDKWTNAMGVINAAFAKANLRRHVIPDPQKKVDQALEEYIAELDPRLISKLTFFIEFFSELPDNPKQKEFDSLIETYFSNFLALTT